MDGQTERVNQDLQQYLRLFTAEWQEEWSEWLALAQFTYNNRSHLATGKAPFAIMRSYVPCMGIEPTEAKAPAANTFAKDFSQILEEACDSLEKAQHRMKEQADKHRSEAIYNEGQMMWLSTVHLNLRTTRQSPKLTKRWLGSYKIKRVINDNTVELLLP